MAAPTPYCGRVHSTDLGGARGSCSRVFGARDVAFTVVAAGDVTDAGLLAATGADCWAGIGGWTMIRDVAGMGHGGFHQGKTIFNDQSGLVMFVGVAEPAAIAEVARGLARLFERRPGVTFLSEVEVIRSDYFAGAAVPPGD